MSQETRQKANRAAIVELLNKAAKEAAKAITEGQKARTHIEKALQIVQVADSLARAKPVVGTKMQPAPIRRATQAAVKTLERLRDKVKATPVTGDERLRARKGKETK